MYLCRSPTFPTPFAALQKTHRASSLFHDRSRNYCFQFSSISRQSSATAESTPTHSIEAELHITTVTSIYCIDYRGLSGAFIIRQDSMLTKVFCRFTSTCTWVTMNAQSLRHVSSSNVAIPPPTWSLKDLHLSSTDKDKPISDDEYHQLAYRCLIDIRIFTPEQNVIMKQSLTDIMRCVSIVSEYKQLKEPRINQSHEKDEISIRHELSKMVTKPMELPKNFCNTARSRVEEQSDWIMHDRKEVEDILHHMKQGKGQKLKRREEDGHWYFSVRTDAESIK